MIEGDILSREEKEIEVQRNDFYDSVAFLRKNFENEDNLRNELRNKLDREGRDTSKAGLADLVFLSYVELEKMLFQERADLSDKEMKTRENIISFILEMGNDLERTMTESEIQKLNFFDAVTFLRRKFDSKEELKGKLKDRLEEKGMSSKKIGIVDVIFLSDMELQEMLFEKRGDLVEKEVRTRENIISFILDIPGLLVDSPSVVQEIVGERLADVVENTSQNELVVDFQYVKDQYLLLDSSVRHPFLDQFFDGTLNVKVDSDRVMDFVSRYTNFKSDQRNTKVYNFALLNELNEMIKEYGYVPGVYKYDDVVSSVPENLDLIVNPVKHIIHARTPDVVPVIDSNNIEPLDEVSGVSQTVDAEEKRTADLPVVPFNNVEDIDAAYNNLSNDLKVPLFERYYRGELEEVDHSEMKSWIARYMNLRLSGNLQDLFQFYKEIEKYNAKLNSKTKFERIKSSVNSFYTRTREAVRQYSSKNMEGENKLDFGGFVTSTVNGLLEKGRKFAFNLRNSLFGEKAEERVIVPSEDKVLENQNGNQQMAEVINLDATRSNMESLSTDDAMVERYSSVPVSSAFSKLLGDDVLKIIKEEGPEDYANYVQQISRNLYGVRLDVLELDHIEASLDSEQYHDISLAMAIVYKYHRRDIVGSYRPLFRKAYKLHYGIGSSIRRFFKAA